MPARSSSFLNRKGGATDVVFDAPLKQSAALLSIALLAIETPFFLMLDF